jgi:uncharacterized protein YecE (DUF72 family)
LSKIWIGTSGFYYDHWIGKCYPEQISKRDLLPFYAERFTTVEVNSTFYHLPRKSTTEHWLEVTPSDFRFTLKAYRGITHYKKLEDARSELLAFLHLVTPLKPKLGVLLFQLPPQLKRDLKLLEDFLAGLPEGYRYAFEFRHASWIGDDLFALLGQYGAGFCINDFDKKQTPWEVTAPFAYVRMHGPGGRYRGRYDEKAIAALGKRLEGMAVKGREVYCYFNNDEEGYAWENAQMLMARCNGAKAR